MRAKPPSLLGSSLLIPRSLEDHFKCERPAWILGGPSAGRRYSDSAEDYFLPALCCSRSASLMDGFT